MKWRRNRDKELDAELRAHLDEAIRDRIERGESPEAARANALRKFGNVGLVKETTREMWGWAALERLAQDLRFGARMLRKHKGFTAATALRKDMLLLIVGQGLKLTVLGLALGLIAAWAATRFVASLLYGVTATDPLTFFVLALLLLAMATLTCWLPARRATQVDPLVALRHE